MLCDQHYTKAELFEKGLQRVTDICLLNKIAVPIIVQRRAPHYGFYSPRKKTICIGVKRCLPPVKTPGFSWSYPGYKADLTPIGVLCHEFGRYLYDVLSLESARWNRIVDEEHEVSGYESAFIGRGDRYNEGMAEAIKLFCTNPDLLRIGRPLRHKYIIERLQHPCIKPWTEVLGNAHPQILHAAENWIQHGSNIGDE